MEVLVSPSIYSDSVFVFVVVVAGEEEEEEEEEEFSSFDFANAGQDKTFSHGGRSPLLPFVVVVVVVVVLIVRRISLLLCSRIFSSSPSPSLQSFVLVRRKRASIFDEDDEIADFLSDLSPAFGPTTERKLSHNARKSFLSTRCVPRNRSTITLFTGHPQRAQSMRESVGE